LGVKAILYQGTSNFLRHIKQGFRHKLLAFAQLVMQIGYDVLAQIMVIDQ
jgi:hypothetical protein